VETFLNYTQLAVLLYFVVVNLTYTCFIFISVKYIMQYGFTGSNYHIKSVLSDVFYRPLSIIVPAFNEESTILASVRSLLNLHYPEFEVIVVDDGSRDGTMARLMEGFRLAETRKPIRLQLQHQKIRAVYSSPDYPNLLVISKENGGKADAINTGINASAYPLFCCLDADSVLENDAVLRAARLFVEDRHVVATGGIIRLMNGCSVENGVVQEIRAPKMAIECFQAVEYIRGFLAGRTAWNFFGSLLIISGAFGIFRKDVVMAIGGYRHTVGEDMDLVVRIHRHCRENGIPYKILFIPDPVCFTQAPNDLKSLRKQRNRWQRGLVDSLWHSRRMLGNPAYGTVGLLAFPYFLLVEALGPLVEFCGYASFLVCIVLGALDHDFAVLFFFVAILWGMWLNVASILLDNILFRRHKGVDDILKLCLFSFLEMLGYRQLMTFERFLATFQVRKKGWGKIKRSEIRVETFPSSS
jgi:cellulose synthase/poly-beta-1,6-N-acetylglucosamine synthase-like glycosyltransferase